MKELLNTINNIKNNGILTPINIFTKKDENKIIKKILNSDKFKEIYPNTDKEKALSIIKCNFGLLASKEENNNYNHEFLVYDNGGSKEIFLYFEGSRARKWSLGNEIIEVQETKTYKTIDNSIVQAATKENKINDLLVEKANKLIESIEIEPNRSAAVYLDYAKENGIKTNDKNSIDRKILQYHLLKYGVSNHWYKAAEKHGVNTKKELCNIYFNQLIEMLKAEEETKTPFKMNLQTLAANKKELKPIFNSNIEGHEEYQKEQLKIYNSGNLKFIHKRINNKMIEEYTKYFIYKDDTFMSVKPGKNYPSGYYDHVRKYDYKVDHVNKVILFTDKEIEEIEPIKNNLRGENMNNNIYIDITEFKNDNKIHDIKDYTIYTAPEGTPERGEIKKFYDNKGDFIRVSKNRLSRFKELTKEQYNLLIRLQAAAEKQRKTGFSSRHKELYNNLQRKIEAVYNGKYNIKDVTIESIAAVGGMIPSININTKGDVINKDNIINNNQINQIKEEFYNNTDTEEQQKENLKLIFDTLESKINNYIEIVDDIEYFDKFINGIVLYFTNGECYQIFIDIDNKVNNNNNFIVLDENINILYNSNDINYIIDNVIKSAQEKNDYINNSKEYIQI